MGRHLERTVLSTLSLLSAFPFGQVIGVVLLVSAAASSGTTDRTLREAATLERRRVATEDQLRIAQDLHDGVGHGLAVIAMQAGVALHVLEKDPAGVRTALEAIRDTSRESLAALRTEVAQIGRASCRDRVCQYV